METKKCRVVKILNDKSKIGFELYFTSDEKIEVGDRVISKLYGLGRVISSQWADNRGKTPMLVQFKDKAIMYGRDGSYKDDGNKIYLNDCYKVVATTDKSLYHPKTIQYGNMILNDHNEDGSHYHCIDCEVAFSLSRDKLIQLGLIVPQIPESFIKQYVEAGGIDEVEIEYEQYWEKSR